METEDKKNLYESAIKSNSLKEQLAKAPELFQTWKNNYSEDFKRLNSKVNNYGGISRLEDNSKRFAFKLRESEKNLKNDLGGKSFFKKKMRIGNYWSVGLLEEFEDFESVVGSDYGKLFIENAVYAKLNKRGDVLVDYKGRVDVGRAILSAIPGAPGIIVGAVLGALPERLVTGLPPELDSPLVVAGAVIGWAGMSFMMYDVFRESTTFTNPLSNGADDLEKRVGVIREALDCQNG